MAPSLIINFAALRAIPCFPEFQGGEALLCYDYIQKIMDYAIEQAAAQGASELSNFIKKWKISF